MTKLEKIVRKQIELIPDGCIFDTHTVASMFFQNDHDAFYKNASNYTSAKLYYAAIGKIISCFANYNGESYSKNIAGYFLKCAAWKKR
jgi:hypothetical protein